MVVQIFTLEKLWGEKNYRFRVHIFFHTFGRLEILRFFSLLVVLWYIGMVYGVTDLTLKTNGVWSHI